jgi:NADPH:quinone reductase
MRALVLHDFGHPLTLHELPIPEPRPGQVLLRVLASGVNPLDLKIKSGHAAHAQVHPPAILGIDTAGIVERLGTGVTGFQPGELVYGMTGGVGDNPGSLAEYSAVDARLIAPAPATLTPRQAAALPLAVITAWEGLVDRAHVGPGMTVLVHGGAGSVGQAAIQIAHAHGARVFATGSPTSLDTIAGLGATPIDRGSTPVNDYVRDATDGTGFDIVYDTLGGESLDASFQAVRTYTGHVVSALGWGTHPLAPLSFRAATYSGVFTLLPLLTGAHREHHASILRAATRLCDTGQLRPTLDPRPFSFETVEDAHATVAAATVRGKVVINIQARATDPDPGAFAGSRVPPLDTA